MENNKPNQLNEMSLSDLREMANLVTNSEEGEVIYQDPQPNEIVEEESNQPTGIVVNEEKPKSDGIVLSGLDPETMEGLGAYMKEIDDAIEEKRDFYENKGIDVEKIESGEFENEEDDTKDENVMSNDEFNRKYEEAVVVIDKTNFGRVINFTDEEREKLEKVKKIKLEEVETISLSSIKTKKAKGKKDVNKILKRSANLHTSNIVLPLSGYTVSLRGCSSFELISLIDSTNNIVEDSRTKWSLIHSKIESTSLGKMDFNEFLHKTAANDYSILVYGLLCATYPDDDSIELKCDNTECGKTFTHRYTIRSLIRAELMNDKLKEIFMNIVDNSYTEATAKKYHEGSAINITNTVELPESKIIVELKVQSAYDLINGSLKSLVDNKDPKYNSASILATTVHRAFVPDPDSNPMDIEYFEFSDQFEITQIVYQLGTKDLVILRTLGEKMLDGMSIEFGLMDVTCPSCRKHKQTIPMDVESILFTRYQQEMSIKVE